ncbi:MAG: HAMP domain-containing sensor histidine kinase [Clostridium sp.]|uniref:sensor histidine kinase n=1 Tax=Clostridium sp. TaxID=1506 RepID=UPI003040B384
MWIIMVIMLITIISLSIFLISLKRDIRSISNQIDKSAGEYVNIRTNVLDSDMETLATKINFLYDESQKVNAIRKNAEEELRQSIANMSHDLRTPLTSIMGYMQLVKDKNTSEEDRKRYLDIVEKRTESLQTLIGSFYELSRIEAKEYNFQLKRVNLSNILCENVALFYNDFISKSIEPIVDIAENIHDIISDENAVIRVFSNLINNMLKHGEGYIKISLKEEDGYILTEFRNLATHLNKEDVPKLFDRFFTADESRGDKNTGLGLCITKTMVEQLGNEIDAKLIDANLVISIRWKK